MPIHMYNSFKYSISGIMDAVNVAKIACALVISKKLTLCVRFQFILIKSLLCYGNGITEKKA